MSSRITAPRDAAPPRTNTSPSRIGLYPFKVVRVRRGIAITWSLHKTYSQALDAARRYGELAQNPNILFKVESRDI